MHVVSKKAIVNFYSQHSTSKSSLQAFYKELEAANWEKPSDVIADYPTADVITGKRFVFNIKGNNYRLVADIEFKKKLVFIVWIGTHAEYNKIDVKTVKYAKSD